MAKESPTPDQAEEASAPADAPAPAAKPKRRRRRWFLRLFLFLTIVGLALIGAAPTLVTSTPLGPRLLPYVAPGVDVEFESLSGGWFAPLAARKIALLDRDGTRLVEVAEITTEKTLLHLVGGYRNLGTIHVVEPRVSVTFRPDGSNLEDALARLMPASSSSSSTTIAYSLDVQSGVVELVDSDGSQGTLQNVSCTIEQTTGEAAGLKLNASASSSLDGQSGRVTAEIASSGGEAKVTLHCDEFDVSKLAPLLRRFAHGVRVEGLLKSDLELTARTDEQSVMTASLSGPLSATGVGVQLPGMHETEQIRFEKIDVGGRIALHGSQLTADGFSIDSELGQLKLSGNVGVAALAGLTSPDQIVAALGTDDFHGEGEIDIAKLIAHLPRTLRLRDDVQVSQGRLEFKLDSKPEEASRVWQGRLAASKFAARIEGQNVTWDQPLEVTLAAHQNTAGVSVDKLLCRSEFVQLLLKGTPEQAVFKARCDLHGLFAEVQRFADLGQVEAAGKLYLRCDWSATPDAPLKADLQALGEQVAFVWPGRKPWREERLEIVGSATGAMLARGVPRFDTATLNLTSGNDHFDGELQQPLTWPLSETPAAVKVHFGGTLQTWLARLQPVVALQGCDLQGVLTGDVRVSVSRDACAIDDLLTEIENLIATGPHGSVDDPLVRLEGSGAWDGKTRSFRTPQLTLRSTALSLRAKDFGVELPAGAAPQAGGRLQFRADLDRLDRLVATLRGAAPSGVVGTTKGTVDLSASTDAVELTAVATADGVTFGTASPNEAVPPLTLNAQARYEPAADRCSFSELSLTTDGLQLAALGSVEQLSSAMSVDAKGTLDCDLERIAERFRGVVGNNVQIAGRETRQFSLHGPLHSPTASTWQTDANGTPVTGGLPLDLTAQAGVGWTSANLYGLTVGPGAVDATLNQGVVQFAPLDLQVGQGRLTATPRILVGANPAVLTLEKGPLLTQMQLSRELCSGWLKFVTPMLADSTDAEGSLSLTLDGAEFPLTALTQGETAGVLAIQSGRIEPGPMAQQFVTIARQVRTLVASGGVKSSGGIAGMGGQLLGLAQQGAVPGIQTSNSPAEFALVLPTQNVEFQMTHGRLHHRSLEVQAGGVTIRTHGSVGFDESVDLMAEVPVQDEWCSKSKLLAKMRGQTLQIPIRGTLGSPQMDPSVLAGLAEQLAGSEIESKLGGVTEKIGGAVESKMGGAVQGLGKLLPFQR